jgi:hypothetical protein
VEGSNSKKPLQRGALSCGSPSIEVDDDVGDEVGDVVVVLAPQRDDKESNNCSVLLEHHSRVLDEVMTWFSY